MLGRLASSLCICLCLCLCLSATTYKRSASTALAQPHNLVGADPRAGRGPFSNASGNGSSYGQIWPSQT